MKMICGLCGQTFEAGLTSRCECGSWNTRGYHTNEMDIEHLVERLNEMHIDSDPNEVCCGCVAKNCNTEPDRHDVGDVSFYHCKERRESND